MTRSRKWALPNLFDLPLGVAAALTVAFYLFVTSASMKDTLIYRYTTEHAVEYVIVGFFIWGLTDAFFRVLTFPRELLALRQEWLPRRTAREPISNAAILYKHLQRNPPWLQESRIGQRLMQALSHLHDKGSADQFADYLHSLADQDYEKTQTNYGLIRFICWVTPMFGFLGTVLHFGTALGGHTSGDIGERLPTVVAEMGTAFNTTTVALTAATTMMFCLFLCERTERGILGSVDKKTERELLNRFQVLDANLTPFLTAVQTASQATLQTMTSALERQMETWSNALGALQRQTEKQQQWQVQVWGEALETLEQKFEANDAEREKRLLKVLNLMATQHQEHQGQVVSTVRDVSGLKDDFARLVASLTTVAQGEGELVRLQATLAENLRLLHDTQQIDQALHGLTAAIHLMTARGQPSMSTKELRAA